MRSARSSRGAPTNRSASAPRAGASPSRNTSWSATASPCATLSRPLPRQASCGAGSSAPRSTPCPPSVPASVPSAAIWPLNRAAVPASGPAPSSARSRAAAPSAPGRDSRSAKFQRRPAICPCPEAVRVPVSRSVAACARSAVIASRPTLIRPPSTFAATSPSQRGGRSAAGRSCPGQGRCQSAPASVSVRASSRPASSGSSASRSRSACAISDPPFRPVIVTPAAVSSGSGSRASRIGPVMRTVLPPSARPARAAIVPRKRSGLTSDGPNQAPAAARTSRAASATGPTRRRGVKPRRGAPPLDPAGAWRPQTPATLGQRQFVMTLSMPGTPLPRPPPARGGGLACLLPLPLREGAGGRGRGESITISR